MNTNWKKTSIGLVMVNDQRYKDGSKTYKINDSIENPAEEQVLSFALAYAEISGDNLDSAEITKVTTVTNNN